MLDRLQLLAILRHEARRYSMHEMCRLSKKHIAPYEAIREYESRYAYRSETKQGHPGLTEQVIQGTYSLVASALRSLRQEGLVQVGKRGALIEWVQAIAAGDAPLHRPTCSATGVGLKDIVALLSETKWVAKKAMVQQLLPRFDRAALCKRAIGFRGQRGKRRERRPESDHDCLLAAGDYVARQLRHLMREHQAEQRRKNGAVQYRLLRRIFLR